MKIFSILVLLNLVGCTPEADITPYQLRTSEEFCSKHGGLQFIDTKSFDVDRFYCADGEFISLGFKPSLPLGTN